MDNFKIIYKILRYLEKAMDYEEPDFSAISPESLGISRERWSALLIMLCKEGYIDGIVWTSKLASGSLSIAEPIHPTITLKGLEYLSENSMMHKAHKLLSGAIEVIK